MSVNQVKRNGSYAPLSAHYYKDDAILRAGEKAEVLWTRGLAFCAEVLSDGFITDMQLAHIVGVRLRGVESRANRLIEEGLWERVEGGYRVPSWSKWNLTKAEIKEKQRKDADRKAGGTK